jgi:hypothetical protein
MHIKPPSEKNLFFLFFIFEIRCCVKGIEMQRIRLNWKLEYDLDTQKKLDF